jgi:hypothetical protein
MIERQSEVAQIGKLYTFLVENETPSHFHVGKAPGRYKRPVNDTKMVSQVDLRRKSGP